MPEESKTIERTGRVDQVLSRNTKKKTELMKPQGYI